MKNVELNISLLFWFWFYLGLFRFWTFPRTNWL